MTRALIFFALLAVLLVPSFISSDEAPSFGHADRVPAHPVGVAPVDHTPTHPPGTKVVRAASATKTSARTWSNEVGSVAGYPCGGDLPSCAVLACESGGNPYAENPHSTASGLWQILDGTWAGYGGYARAVHAPVHVQNEKAALLWAGGAGAFHWRSCL